MKIKVNLISGRTIDQGKYLEAKTGKGYFNACACCELNSADLKKLGASEGDSLKVTTEFGEVVVFAKQMMEIRKVLPLSRWGPGQMRC